MKKWMIWLIVSICVVAGAAWGVAKVFDPQAACLNSGGHWKAQHCEY